MNLASYMKLIVFACFARTVFSDEFSTSASSRSWRYRAVTIAISVRGSHMLEDDVRTWLKEGSRDLDGLVLGNDDRLGDRRLTNINDVS